MAKYAGPDNIEETAGTAAPEGERFSILRMARLLEVSTSGYYQYVKRRVATVLTPRQQRRADLEVKIVEIHKDSKGTYGSPRVTAELLRLRRQVGELEKDNAFLVKASAYFAAMQKNRPGSI